MSFAYDAVSLFVGMCVPVCPCETATEPTVQNVCIHVEVKSVQNKWVICSGTTTTDCVYYLVQHQWHGMAAAAAAEALLCSTETGCSLGVIEPCLRFHGPMAPVMESCG